MTIIRKSKKIVTVWMENEEVYKVFDGGTHVCASSMAKDKIYPLVARS